MIKLVIFKLEGVVFQEEILRFKYYEKLWHYLRRDSQWKNFKQLIIIKNNLERKTGDENAYLKIADKYLSERDYARYIQELNRFTQLNSSSYIRLIPGMTAILSTLRYYYKTALFSINHNLYDIANKRFRLDTYFNHQFDGSAYSNRLLNSELFNKIMHQARVHPRESILVSDRLHRDIAPAIRLGIPVVQVVFNQTAKGISPQNIMERQYFEIAEKTTYAFATGKKWPEETAPHTAASPEEILRIIHQYDRGASAGEKEPEVEKKVGFLDIFKEVLLPEFEDSQE